MIDHPLSYVMIQPNVISERGLKEIMDYVKNASGEDLSVFDSQETNKTGQISWQVDKKTRDTQIIDVVPIFPLIRELMSHAVKNFVNPFYEVEVDSSEIPQILSYEIGGHYKPHVDAEGMWTAPVDRDWETKFFTA